MYDKEENKNKTPLSVKCTISYLTDSHLCPWPWLRTGAHTGGRDQLERQNTIKKKKKLRGMVWRKRGWAFNFFLNFITRRLGEKTSPDVFSKVKNGREWMFALERGCQGWGRGRGRGQGQVDSQPRRYHLRYRLRAASPESRLLRKRLRSLSGLSGVCWSSVSIWS